MRKPSAEKELVRMQQSSALSPSHPEPTVLCILLISLRTHLEEPHAGGAAGCLIDDSDCSAGRIL